MYPSSRDTCSSSGRLCRSTRLLSTGVDSSTIFLAFSVLFSCIVGSGTSFSLAISIPSSIGSSVSSSSIVMSRLVTSCTLVSSGGACVLVGSDDLASNSPLFTRSIQSARNACLIPSKKSLRSSLSRGGSTGAPPS